MENNQDLQSAHQEHEESGGVYGATTGESQEIQLLKATIHELTLKVNNLQQQSSKHDPSQNRHHPAFQKEQTTCVTSNSALQDDDNNNQKCNERCSIYYEKLSGGATITGPMYEVKITLLACLRFLKRGDLFQLALNRIGFGKFDDIVIMKDAINSFTCVQLKHKETCIRRSQLLAFEGEYSLLTYFKSYRDDLMKGSKNFKMIFYTNSSMVGHTVSNITDEEMLASGRKSVIFNFTEQDKEVYNHASNIKIYKRFLINLTDRIDSKETIDKEMLSFESLNKMEPFKHKLAYLKQNLTIEAINKLLSEVDKVGDLSLYHIFLEKFQVYCNQSTEEELMDIINNEFEALCGIRNTSDIGAKLVNQVNNWSKSKKGRCLTESEPIWYEAIIGILNDSKLNEVTSYNIKFQSDIIDLLRIKLQSCNVLHIYLEGEFTVLAVCKVHQALKDVAESESWPIFTTVKYAFNHKHTIFGAWTSYWGRVLVLEADEVDYELKELMPALKKILKSHQEKTLVIVTNINDLETIQDVRTFRGDRYFEYKDTTTLLNLVDEARNRIMDTKVTFQGYKVALHDLIRENQEIMGTVNEEILIKILKEEEIKIDDNLPDPIDHYIPRTLRREDKSFMVEKSNDFQDRAVIVVGEPGMGKSTLLTYLSRKIKLEDSCTWVVFVNLNNHTVYLNSIKKSYAGSTTSLDFMRTVAGISSNNNKSLEKYIFENCWQSTGKIVLLLDGFDEICPPYELLVTNIVKDLLQTCIDKIWITSRIICKEVLEKAVQSTSFLLEAFTECDQRMFLKNVWYKYISNTETGVIEDFINKILERIALSLNDEEKFFTGIPLQTMFIAETFEKHIKLLQVTGNDNLPFHIDILKLYEDFFLKVCERNYREKRCIDITKKSVESEFEHFVKHTKEIHELCALVLLLPPNDIKRLHDNTISFRVNTFISSVAEGNDLIGVINSVINDKPVFTHRTFAEYFVASWFTKHYQINRSVIADLLHMPSFKVVFTIFNKIFCKDSKLHMAVINNDSESLLKLLVTENVNVLDIGHRTPLHLAAGFAPKQIFTRILLERGANINLVDNVLGWTPLRYADAAKMWGAVGLLLQNGGSYSDLPFVIKNINHNDYIGPALRVACEQGHEKLITFLIKNGASVDFELDSEYHRPIHIAVRCAQISKQLILESGTMNISLTTTEQIVDKLMTCGTNINCRTLSGKTIAHFLAETGNVSLLRYVMKRKMNESDEELALGTKRLLNVLNGTVDVIMRQKVMIHYRDAQGQTAIDVAEQHGNKQMVGFLKNTRYALDDYLRNSTTTMKDHLLFSTVRFLVGERQADIHSRDNGENTPLHLAANTGDVHTVEYLLGLGAAKSVKNKNGDTPLHNAAYYGHLDVVTYLTETCNTNLDIRSSNDATPLHKACIGGCLPVVQYLVKRGVTIDAQDIDGDTALHYAAQYGNLDIVQYLTEICQIDINISGCNNQTPIHNACYGGHFNIVQYLMKNGARAEARDIYSNTPLHRAAHNGKLNIIKYMAEIENVDINIQGQNNVTPLHVACEQGHFNVVQYLINFGADQNSCDMNGSTPLHYSAHFGKLDIVNYLLDLGYMNLLCLNNHHMTLLHFACAGGHCNVVKYLVNKGVDPNSTDAYGDTPLHRAAFYGKEDVVYYLVKSCHINPNILNSSNRSPLHIACAEGHLNVVVCLKTSGAATELKDINDDTLLHLSAMNGKLGVLKYLVKTVKMNVNLLGWNNQTPLHAACEGGHLKVVEYLVRNGAKTDHPDKIGSNTPLHCCTYLGKLSIVKYLIQKCDVSVDVVNNNFSTPLHVACKAGHTDVVKYLTKMGAKPDACLKNGNTPLHLAAYHGQLNVVMHLIYECHIDPDTMNADALTPLYLACLGGHLDVMKTLIKKGAQSDICDRKGSTLLHQAAKVHKLSVVMYLVEECNMDINSYNNYNFTPLHEACSKGHFDVVQYLIGNGAVADASYRNGNTALHTAVYYGQLNIVKYLLEVCKINYKVPGWTNQTILQSACEGGQLHLVQYLVANAPALQQLRDKNGFTITHHSAYYNTLDVMKYQVEECFLDINAFSYSKLTPLHVACSEGHIDMVKYLVNNGAEITQCDKNGIAALHYASLKGKLNVVKYLLEKYNVDPNLPGWNDQTPFHAACEGGYLKVAEYLVKKGAKSNGCDNSGFSPLHYAAYNGKLNITKFLIQTCHVNPNVCSTYKTTPIHMACKGGHLGLVHFLISIGADIHACDVDGNTALHISSLCGKQDVIKSLIEDYNISHFLPNKYNMTPFHMACKGGHLDAVQYLEKNGAVTDSCNVYGNAPLHQAAYYGNLNIVAYLIAKCQADPNIMGWNNQTPLHAACEGGHLDVAKYLIKKGANMNSRSVFGNSPLHRAAEHGQLEVLKVLLREYRFNRNAPNKVGLTPLHLGSMRGHLGVMQYLIAKGANYDARDCKGNTLLHLAAQSCQLNVLKYIAEQCCSNMNSCNNDNETPLHLACKEGHLPVVPYLVLKGAKINACTKNGDTPLHTACYFGELDIVKYFVEEFHINCDIPGWNNETPLHSACESGHLSIAQYYLNNGANRDAVDYNGATPLHRSARNGKLNIVTHLVEEWHADINTPGWNNESPLHVACEGGHLDVVKYLVRKCARIDARDTNGFTPLHRTAFYEKLNIMTYLVQHCKININIISNTKLTPLHLAYERGNQTVVDYLLKNGAERNACDIYGDTPLSRLVHIGQRKDKFSY